MKIKTICLNLLVLLVLISSNLDSFSQMVPTVSYGSIQLGDFALPSLSTKDRSQYPYLDIGLVVQNTEKLSDAEFLKRFDKVTNFYTEIKARYNDETFSVPIVLLQKEKSDRGSFVSINNINIKVFEKIPIITNSDISPSFTISNVITIQNGLIKTLRDLTENANTLLSLDIKTSLNKPKEVLSFVSKVLSEFESKTFSVTTSFSPFMFDDADNKIYDFKLTAVIPPQERQLFRDNLFKVRRNGTEIKVQYDGKDFEYPFCLLTLSLSNYVYLNGLPSSYVTETGLNDLSDLTLDKMMEFITKNRSRLTSNQAKYEYYLLEYLKTYNAIRNGEIYQRRQESTERDLKLIQAYDYLFDYPSLDREASNMQALGRELFNKYKVLLAPIKEGIDSISTRLDHSTLCSKIFRMKKLGCENISNDNLSSLSKFRTATTKLSYLKQVKFSYDIDGKIDECENFIYRTKFKEQCDDLLNSNINKSSKAYENLKDLKMKFSNCKICLEKAFSAEKEYERLSTLSANRQREVNVILLRVEKSISDFERDANSLMTGNNVKILDSKDSSGTNKLSLPFTEVTFQNEKESVVAQKTRISNLRDSKSKSEAEKFESEVTALIEQFKQKYFFAALIPN